MTTEELKAICEAPPSAAVSPFTWKEVAAAVLALIAERDETDGESLRGYWKARAEAAEAKAFEAENKATGWAMAHDDLLDRVEALERALRLAENLLRHLFTTGQTPVKWALHPDSPPPQEVINAVCAALARKEGP